MHGKHANAAFAWCHQKMLPIALKSAMAADGSARASCGRPFRAYNEPSPR